MIRLIQRRLIIPRGDTGTLSIPVLAGKNVGDVPIFTIFNTLTHRKVFEKIMEIADSTLTIEFKHGDTVNLPVGQYVWDIKFYTNPVFADEKLVSGTEVDSYYAAFNLPICEIRETGDNLLMADDAPTSTLRPDQINLIEVVITDINASKNAAALSETNAAQSASNASISETNAEQYATDALSSKNAAIAAQSAAANSAAAAEASASQAAATAQAIHEEIPTKVSDLLDDSGHYTKPANGIPASDLEETYLTQHQDISGKANSADLATVATSGSYNDLQNKPTIPDVQINGSSIIENGVANIPVGGVDTFGVVKIDPSYGIEVSSSGYVRTSAPSESQIKKATQTAGTYRPIVPSVQHISTFYGLAKAAGDTTQKNSDNAVGTYTDGAKTAIQNMLGVPAASAIPTLVSQLTNDSGYLTSYTETDPTVPAWAKAQNKPTYTASEVGAPTVAEMNTAIGTAIGNINSFDMSVVQELPSQDISTHTIYLVPKTGDTNDVYDEYVYINNAWEMVGNTQIDLSNYVQKTDIASSTAAGIIKVANSNGIGISNDTLIIQPANTAAIKAETDTFRPITPSSQKKSVFYGLASAAGDTTQKDSANSVGTYTTEAKAAIQNMLGVPATSDLSVYATKTDTILDTTLSRGRKDNTTAGTASLAFGVNTEASGYYSVALGLNTTASSQGAYAEGKGTVAHYISHAEGEDSQALGSWSHAQNLGTIANGGASSANGRHTIANGADSFVIGKYNAADSYDNWPTWIANTSYEVGDRVKRNLIVQNEPTDVGYHCTIANNDETFDNAHWELDGYHMNYVEIVGNGDEYEDPETHQMVRAGSNAYALEWNGTAHYAGDVYVNANADSSGGTKVATISDIPNVPVQDVQVNGSSIVSNEIANLVLGDGLRLENGLTTNPAGNTAIKAGTATDRPIAPARQHTSVFYGLAKAAGDISQASSANAVGTYTTTAATAIKTMLQVQEGLEVVRLI